MTDIVRLLRADHFTQDTWQNRHTDKLQNKAADEIEGLRSEIERLRLRIDQLEASIDALEGLRK